MTLSNLEIKTGIRELVKSERGQFVLFLRYLIEVEEREIFLEEGCPSIHDFCESVLGLSRGTALKRVWVSRAARRFPAVLDYLEEGLLHLDAVCCLIKHLTEDNHRELLDGAVGKKESELKWWIASLFPETLPPDWELNGREKIVALDGERAKFVLVVDAEFIEKLQRAKEIHRHQVPNGNALEILKLALTSDLKKHDPIEQAKRARKPVATLGKPRIDSRLIPAGIKYEVQARAGHQCTFISAEGRRCPERGGLELDHQRPWATGGRSDDANNLELRCFAHNRFKGRLDFRKDYRRDSQK